MGSVPWLLSQHDREGIVYNSGADGPGLGLSIRPHPLKRKAWQEDLRGHKDDLGKRWEFMIALPKPEPVALLEPRVYKPYEPRFVPVPMPKGAAARLEAKRAALVRGLCSGGSGNGGYVGGGGGWEVVCESRVVLVGCPRTSVNDVARGGGGLRSRG